MSKIVDPVIDYFLQIPLTEGNILQFLAHNGFNVSKVQHPDGSTKAIMFYNVSYPSKNVQFEEEIKGVENFLYPLQHTCFFILDEKEMTFLIKTPLSSHGIAIERGDNDMNFPFRTVKHSGEGILSTEKNNHINLQEGSNTVIIPHPILQKIFMNFVQGKKILEISDILYEYRNLHKSDNTQD